MFKGGGVLPEIERNFQRFIERIGEKKRFLEHQQKVDPMQEHPRLLVDESIQKRKHTILFYIKKYMVAGFEDSVCMCV